MRAIHDQTRALLIINLIMITRLWRALHGLQRMFTSMISLNSGKSAKKRLVSGISYYPHFTLQYGSKNVDHRI